MLFQYTTFDRSKNIGIQIARLWEREQYATSIDKQHIAAHILWKYKPPFTRLELVTTIARIVSSCGSIHQEAFSCLGKLKIMWGTDALADKNYSKKHPFLFAHAYRKILGPEVRVEKDITFTFPNKNFINQFLRIGWKKIQSAQIYVKCFTSAGLRHAYPSKRHSLIIQALLAQHNDKNTIDKQDPAMRYMKIKKFPPDWDLFVKNVSKKYSFIPLRSSNILKWRLLECPTHKYDVYLAMQHRKIIGYFALRYEKKNNVKIGFLTDILCDPDKTIILNNILRQICTIFKEKKVDIAHTIAISKQLKQMLQKNAFYPGEKVDMLYFSTKERKLKHLLLRQDSWHISMADGDFEMEN